MNNEGHGHVFPRADGVRMRCDAERMCSVCQQELRFKEAGYTELPPNYLTMAPEQPPAAGKVTLDLPLFIRLLEIAREELKTDADLHYLVDRVTDAQAGRDVLTMDDYSAIAPSGELTAATEDGDVAESITLSGTPECVDRVKALLAMVSINGSTGHSGTFGIFWDGDGADRLDVSFDTSPYSKLVRELCAYGGEIEVVGTDRTGFIGRGRNDGTAYLDYKRIYPQEKEMKINASARLTAEFTGAQRRAVLPLVRAFKALPERKWARFIHNVIPSDQKELSSTNFRLHKKILPLWAIAWYCYAVTQSGKPGYANALRNLYVGHTSPNSVLEEINHDLRKLVKLVNLLAEQTSPFATNSPFPEAVPGLYTFLYEVQKILPKLAKSWPYITKTLKDDYTAK